MSDPLSFLPLALAARSGTVDGTPASQFVAAGLTLLQRSPLLVRALSGRRAGILLPTVPAYLTALAASDGRGAVLMNPLASPVELAYQIADAGIGAVFTSRDLQPRLPIDVPTALLDDAPRSARVIAGGVSRDVDLGSHVALSIQGDPDTEASEEEAVIVYTSAMNGRALGAILSHRNLLTNARATIEAAAITASDHALAALPLSHLFGLVAAALAPLLAGARVTTVARFRPVQALEAFERDGVTMFVGVPAMFIAMLDALARRGAARLDAPALRLCICGGALLDASIQSRWQDATGVELRQGYGLTEASPVVLVNGMESPNVLGSLGRPFPGVDVTIRDLETFGARTGSGVGEICVRGPTVFQGYVQSRGAPVARGLEVRDGWLRTGDLGEWRPDGTVAFRGLLKAMFTRNGFNIYPRELEVAIEELPGVTAARISAVPDLLKEHAIVADVEGRTTVEDVRLWCAARLSAYKQPTIITISGR